MLTRERERERESERERERECEFVCVCVRERERARERERQASSPRVECIKFLFDRGVNPPASTNRLDISTSRHFNGCFNTTVTVGVYTFTNSKP